MIFLKIESQKAFFTTPNIEVRPEEMSKDNLFEILNMVFENHDNIVFPDEEELNSIVNPIEKEIVHQIISKIKELHANVPNISQEIKSEFPDLDN